MCLGIGGMHPSVVVETGYSKTDKSMTRWLYSLSFPCTMVLWGGSTDGVILITGRSFPAGELNATVKYPTLEGKEDNRSLRYIFLS